MSDLSIRARLLPSADGEGAMRHRSAVVESVNADGTLTVNVGGVSVDVPALSGCAATVGETVHLAAWAGDLLAVGRTRPANTGGPGGHVAIPTSIAVGSGAATFDGDVVNIAAVGTYLSLNGVFDGTGADVYGLTLIADCTEGATLTTRLRVGGVDTAGTAYARTAHYTQLAAGPTRSTATGQAQFGLWSLTTAGTTRSIYGQAVLFRPMLAAQTGLHLISELVANSDWYLWREVGTGPSTAHDGISLLLSAGTMTGSLKVVKLA